LKNQLCFPSLKHTFKFFILTLAAVMISGCANTTVLKNPAKITIDTSSPKKVVVMPMDVELSLLTASGLTEPKAEWTESAIRFMNAGLKQRLGKSDDKVTFYKSTATDAQSSLLQLEKLHQATGYTILTHDLMMQLPSKKIDKEPRTLGPAAVELSKQTGADYGLFIFVRDTYTSGGRAALMFFAAAAGVGIQGGTQVGFASLVDLKTGNIVWFNRLISGTGDLRNEADADKTISSLMTGFPLN